MNFLILVLLLLSFFVIHLQQLLLGASYDLLLLLGSVAVSVH
jgi:hypothetical protein